MFTFSPSSFTVVIISYFREGVKCYILCKTKSLPFGRLPYQVLAASVTVVVAAVITAAATSVVVIEEEYDHYGDNDDPPGPVVIATKKHLCHSFRQIDLSLPITVYDIMRQIAIQFDPAILQDKDRNPLSDENIQYLRICNAKAQRLSWLFPAYLRGIGV